MIISNIPIGSIDIDKQEDLIERLRDENRYLIKDAAIEKVYWLGRPKPGKKDSAVVVEFKDPAVANACLDERIAWEGKPKKTERYHRDCQICQCFKCHTYGHTARTCTSKERCGYCSSRAHTTKQHPDPKDSTTHKCPLCNKNHTAWSPQCEHRKKAVAKVQEAKKQVKENPYFSTVPILTPGVSQRGSRQSSDNGSGAPVFNPALGNSANHFPVLPNRATTPEPMEVIDDGYTPVKGKKRGARGQMIAFTSGKTGTVSTGRHNKRKLFSPMGDIEHSFDLTDVECTFGCAQPVVVEESATVDKSAGPVTRRQTKASQNHTSSTSQ